MKKINNSWNPILTPDDNIPDCEGHVVYKDRLYVFGSEDKYLDKYCSKEYIAASTPDLKHWTVHNPIFSSDRVAWQGEDQSYQGGVDWTKPSPFLKKMFEADKKNGKEVDFDHFQVDDIYAPDVIEKNGKFYLFFCSSDVSEGVAVADNPAGPYHDAVRLHVDGIDPSVFVDDDGQAYLYWGQFQAHVAKLSDDLLSVDETSIKNDVLTESEHYFHEGSSVRKINGTYYYVYASISHGKPTSLDYATGDSPMGPFKYRGTIINNDGCNPGNWNNHGSIGKFHGQWYVFYHRSSQGNEYHRRLCIEPITINADGSIDEVPMTSQGVGQALPADKWISSYRVCGIKGQCYLQPTSVGNEILTNIHEKDCVVFRYFDFQSTITKMSILGQGSAELTVFADKVAVGTVSIKNGDISTTDLRIKAGTRQTISLEFNHCDHFELATVKFEA